MNKPKRYNLPEVFNNTKMGFTFEFYSSKAPNFIVENLSKLTVKNVILTNSETYQPTFGNSILLKEYEGEKPRYSFKLDQQNFNSILPIIKGVLNWINETADCTFDTNMHVNLSFDHSRLNTLQTISKMNTNKLILQFDEKYIYERFENQKASPYSMSIKQLLPITNVSYTHDIVKNVNYIVGVPEGQHYGINFEDYSKGLLEFNYIGGVDYAEKEKEIIELLEYYVIKTYQSLNEIDYNREDLHELEDLTKDFYKIQEAYYEPAKFNELFPDIRVMINVKQNDQLLKTYWPKIRNQLFEMVINNNFRKGDFNYDSDISQYQLRRADIRCTSIKNYDLVLCNIQGIVENCNLISCKVNNARIHNSNIVNGNEINKSYLNKVSIEMKNEINECFVENNYEVINCNISNSILKFVSVGRSAKLDESTVLIDKQERAIHPSFGVEVEEIRDYKWLKNLLGEKPESKVFANEYIKKRYI